MKRDEFDFLTEDATKKAEDTRYIERIEVARRAILERAHAIILDAMNANLETWCDGDDKRVALAQWVIEKS